MAFEADIPNVIGFLKNSWQLASMNEIELLSAHRRCSGQTLGRNELSDAKLSTIVTEKPLSHSLFVKCLPTNPAPPVIRACLTSFGGRSLHILVSETAALAVVVIDRKQFIVLTFSIPVNDRFQLKSSDCFMPVPKETDDIARTMTRARARAKTASMINDNRILKQDLERCIFSN